MFLWCSQGLQESLAIASSPVSAGLEQTKGGVCVWGLVREHENQAGPCDARGVMTPREKSPPPPGKGDSQGKPAVASPWWRIPSPLPGLENQGETLTRMLVGRHSHQRDLIPSLWFFCPKTGVQECVPWAAPGSGVPVRAEGAGQRPRAPVPESLSSNSRTTKLGGPPQNRGVGYRV